MAQVEIENVFLITSFSVLEDQTMDMLLGLDMLKRHQVSISCEKIINFFGGIFFLNNLHLDFSAQLIYNEMFCASGQRVRKQHFYPKVNFQVTVNLHMQVKMVKQQRLLQ